MNLFFIGIPIHKAFPYFSVFETSMKNAPYLFIFFIFYSVTLIGQSTTPQVGIKDKQAVYTLFKDGIVHSEPGKTDTLSFLIYKNSIVSIGKSSDLEIPENTVIQNWESYHIYPSFIEFNSGYGLPPIHNAGKNPNRPVYWNDAIHPEVDAADLFTPDEKAAESLQKMGFGYAVSQIKNGIMRGTSLLSQTGKGDASEHLLKSKVATNLSFEKGKSKDDYPKSLMGSIALLRQVYYDLEWYKSASNKEGNFSLDALEKTADLPACFETQDKYDISRLARIADEFNKRYIIFDAGDAYQIRQPDLKWADAVVAPLNFPKAYDMSDPDLGRYVSQNALWHWERAPFNPFFIQQNNIRLILSGNGVAKPETFFTNLQLSIQKGLDRDSAFAALTTTPANILEMGDKIGKIEEGFLANFFISRGDVFTDKDVKIIAHWINGKENVFESIDKHKLEAVYTLNVNDVYFELQVKGDDKYTAKVLYISGADTTEMKAKLTLQSNEVSLQFLDKEKGYYRLGGTIISDNRIWNGRGYSPDGHAVEWNAIRRRAKAKSTKSDTLVVFDSIPLPPQRYYPMVAYGFDSIPNHETVVFKNATVWTNDSLGILENADVMIAFGRIVAVGKNLDPDGFLDRKNKGNFRVIDAKGKHITAGIIDEHSHIAITRGVNEGTQASTAEVRISDALNPEDINIYRQLAGGVTTSQLLHGSANPIGGQSALIKLRWGQPYEKLLFESASPFIKFALGENVKQSNWGPQNTTRYPQTRMGVEQFFYEYFYRAKEYGELKQISEAHKEPKKGRKKKKREEEDYQPFRKDLEMEALLEILNGERFITCHSYVQSEINMLMHVADSMGFKVNTFTHILEGYKLADKMKNHGAAGSTFSDWWAYKYEVKDAIPYNASLLNQAGVLTGINSDDAEMARRLNQEAAKSLKYGGMSEEEALKMVTLNPAKMLHIDHRVGSLSPGKDADLVIWSGHPLSVYSMAEKTFVDGIKYFDRSQLIRLKNRDLEERARISELMDKAADKGQETQKPERKMERYYHCDTEE